LRLCHGLNLHPRCPIDWLQTNSLIKQLTVRQRNNSSSPPLMLHITTTCFGHTTIIRCHTVVYCLKLFAWMQCMTETCCGNNIRGEDELLLWRTINCLMNMHTQQDAHHSNHNSWLHIQLTTN
jgi:hypothetical protein